MSSENIPLENSNNTAALENQQNQSISSFCQEYTMVKDLQLLIKTGKEKEREMLALLEKSKKF
jgi:hypothetical protein